LVETLGYRPEDHGFDSWWGDFLWLDLSSYIVALRSTATLTEMSARYFTWTTRWPVPRADKLITIMYRFSKILEVSGPI
jgi:hypothetical protein